MKKLIILICTIVVLCNAAKNKECNVLLNCKTCLDETHCEDCPDGYVLGNDKVCRFDCAAKFGEACTDCTEAKCICPSGQKWNGHFCEAILSECAKDDVVCSLCGKDYSAINVKGKCSTCADTFGTGCSKCSVSNCTEIKDGFKRCGVKVVPSDTDCSEVCSDLFPGCSECNEDKTECVTCENGLVLVDGVCSFDTKQCDLGKTLLNNGGSLSCGSCSDLDQNCVPLRCSSRGCTLCKFGFALSSSGTCFNCSNTFPGCSLCQEDACTKCLTSSNILTPNGCISQSPYVPSDELSAGAIVGIVLGSLALLALISLAVYCVAVRATGKHGTIDPSLYEDDLEFKSVSVL